MTDNSFQFGIYNSIDDWGIHVVTHDFLMPQKRENKVVIPHRSGAYDYGARYYDERVLSIECQLTKKISKTALRQIAGILSEKKQIRLYDEPQLYYIGEIYSPADVVTYPQEYSREFTLDFVCEPFAYGEMKAVAIHTGVNAVEYGGTVETPCIINLKNMSNEATKVQIATVKRG